MTVYDARPASRLRPTLRLRLKPDSPETHSPDGERGQEHVLLPVGDA